MKVSAGLYPKPVEDFRRGFGCQMAHVDDCTSKFETIRTPVKECKTSVVNENDASHEFVQVHNCRTIKLQFPYFEGASK